MLVLQMLLVRSMLSLVTVGDRVRDLAKNPEFGGGRNTDEGFHIGAGVLIAAVIAGAVGLFVANKMGVLTSNYS